MHTCRLYEWDAEHGGQEQYAPPFSVDNSECWEDLCRKSRVAQLTGIVKSQQLLHIANPLCLHHVQADLGQLEFSDYNSGQAQLQMRQSFLFYDNDNNAKLSAVLETAKGLAKRCSKRGVRHVVIMPCWSDQQFLLQGVKNVCSGAFEGKGTVHCIYSTAPVASLAKQSSASSDQSGSDIEDTADQQMLASKAVAHLVIGFSLGDKGKRPLGDAMVEGTPAKSRRTSASDTMGGGSTIAGPSVSPPLQLASPSSNPTTPTSSWPPIQAQASLLMWLAGANMAQW